MDPRNGSLCFSLILSAPPDPNILCLVLQFVHKKSSAFSFSKNASGLRKCQWNVPSTLKYMSRYPRSAGLLSDPQSPSSKAFVAAQCSILAAKLQETAKEPPSEEKTHSRIRRIDAW